MKKTYFVLLILVLSTTTLFSQTFTAPLTLGFPNPNNPIDFGCDGDYSLQLDDGIDPPGNRADATAIWCNSHTIDLTESFTTVFNIRFADLTEADGIVFSIQREGLSAINGGGGHLGVADTWSTGISPSVNVEFDIWDNGIANTDIAEDHVAISYNSNLSNPEVAPSAISMTNNTWHNVVVNWNSCDNTLTVTMDGTEIASLTDDLTNSVFGGDPTGIIFGFTSATQNSNTSHDLCFISHRTGPCSCEEIAEPTLDLFSPLCAPEDCCIGASLYSNSTVPYTVVYDWGDGTTSYDNTHQYTSDGTYTVTAILQYQLLGDPLACCTKTVEQVATMRCRGELEGKSPRTSIEIIDGATKATLYPNPVQKGTILTLELTENKFNGQFSVYSIEGTKIMDISSDSDAVLTVNIPMDMASGMYFIKSSNDEIEPLKFYVSE